MQITDRAEDTDAARGRRLLVSDLLGRVPAVPVNDTWRRFRRATVTVRGRREGGGRGRASELGCGGGGWGQQKGSEWAGERRKRKTK